MRLRHVTVAIPKKVGGVEYLKFAGRKSLWDMGAAERSHRSVLPEAQVVWYHADQIANVTC